MRALPIIWKRTRTDASGYNSSIGQDDGPIEETHSTLLAVDYNTDYKEKKRKWLWSCPAPLACFLTVDGTELHLAVQQHRRSLVERHVFHAM